MAGGGLSLLAGVPFVLWSLGVIAGYNIAWTWATTLLFLSGVLEFAAAGRTPAQPEAAAPLL